MLSKMFTGTPKKVTVTLKDSEKSDKSFCALCSCDTDSGVQKKNRKLLFEPKTDIKTALCLSLEQYFNRSLTLESDSRCVCQNCYRRLDIQIKKWKQEKEDHIRARAAYRECINIRVKRGRRCDDDDFVGNRGKSVKSLIFNYESLASSDATTDPEEFVEESSEDPATFTTKVT